MAWGKKKQESDDNLDPYSAPTLAQAITRHTKLNSGKMSSVEFAQELQRIKEHFGQR
ncbi:MAG TPA: hypothetical protein VHZ03_38950 [Trebonia sp.]|jgi:hypothetical protein|nr:hypothetical protein [Trebonia sp.]